VNYYPLRPDSITATPAGTGQQLFLINPDDRPVTIGPPGSLAGYEYRLPPLARSAPVVQIVAMGNESFSVPGNEAAKLLGASDYRHWLICTKDPTGKDLMRYAPLSQFVIQPANDGVRRKRRVLLNHWIDPLQSHLICTVDGLVGFPCVQFIYGHV
jgi:hypothetical protein